VQLLDGPLKASAHTTLLVFEPRALLVEQIVQIGGGSLVVLVGVIALVVGVITT